MEAKNWTVSPSHVALRVKNLKECIKFYNEILGLSITRLVGDEDNPRVCFLPGLELINGNFGERPLVYLPKDIFLGKAGEEMRDEYYAEKRPEEELYDLRSDPLEMNNLADDEKY